MSGGVCIEGTVEKVLYYNEENGYAVLQLLPTSISTESVNGNNDDTPYQSALPGMDPSASNNSHHSLVTVTGEMLKCDAERGATLIVNGVWFNHTKYGKQIKMHSYSQPPPEDADSILTYLSNNQVKGIGPVIAKRIVSKFGNDTYRILDEEPIRLREVKGIGKKTLQDIIDSWQENQENRATVMWLQAHGIRPNLAVRVVKHFQGNARVIAQTNPYQFTEVPGIAFATADQIAREMGIGTNDIRRVRAGITYVLEQMAFTKGHTFAPFGTLESETSEMLGVERGLIVQALDSLLDNGTLVEDIVYIGDTPTTVYYLQYLRDTEVNLAIRIRTLLQEEQSPFTFYQSNPDQLDRILEEVSGDAGIELHSLQVEAIRSAILNKVTVITGGPGTGKTTCLKTLLDILDLIRENQRKLRYCLASPTGKAAKRLEEATGRPAQTIHRLLEFRPKEGFTRNEYNPLDETFIIIDEASMIDLPLAEKLLRAVRSGAHLLLVGDIDQLPSVGVGNVLRDLIVSNAIPVIRLQVIFRQAEQSSIVSNAHRINAGQMPVSENNVDTDDCFILKESNAEVAARKIVQMVQRLPHRYGLDPVTEIQVLTPQYRGVVGVHSLNLLLQNALNPFRSTHNQHIFGQYLRPGSQVILNDPPESLAGVIGVVAGVNDKEVVISFPTQAGQPDIPFSRSEVEKKLSFPNTYRVKDKVINTVNDYDKNVFNGDWGIITRIDVWGKELAVDYDGREVSYTFAEVREKLTLAYALTIHKSQGSEWPCVIIPIMTAHFIMLKRNLLYTGLTRAREYAVIIGQSNAIRIAVTNNEVELRYSALDQRLRGKQ